MNMANQSTSVASSTYIPFATHMNTNRYHHAVGLIGQRTMLLVLETLIQGDVEQMMAALSDALGGCLAKFFTNVEILKLEEENPSQMDLSLLYKVDQLVCGLAPMYSKKWTMQEDGDDSLEHHLYTMKQLRNEVTHNFHNLVLSDLQLATALEDLRALTMKVLGALSTTAEERNIKIEIDRVEDFQAYVNDVITDVRQQIVEV